MLKDGACQLLLNTAAKKPTHTLFVIPKEIDIATFFSFAIMNDNRLLYYYCCMIKLAIVILWQWWVAQEDLALILGHNGLKSFLKNGIVYLEVVMSPGRNHSSQAY